MMILSKTHWKKLTNPDYIGSYALLPGEEKVLTIKRVSNEIVTGSDGKKEECQVAYFMEDEKPMILNKTNMKTIERIYKTPYVEDWAGKKITIYSEKVKAFGEVVDALRIKKSIPKDIQEPKLMCDKCGKEITPAHGMTQTQLAAYTMQKYRVKVCAECAVLLTKTTANEDNKPSESEEKINENNQN